MTTITRTRITAFLTLLFMSFACRPAHAQLDQFFSTMFNSFLTQGRFLTAGVSEQHASHYLPAADIAAMRLTPALNKFIASNISSFPLSSTIAGFTLDMSTGRPRLTSESLGPIFAETAETIGPGKISIGLSYSYLNLDRIRGLPLTDMRFTFIHQDVTDSPPFGPDESVSGSLGNPGFELDNIDVYPGLDINSNIFVFALTLGVTRNMDISLAVPIVNVTMSANAYAVINSFTYGRLNPSRPEFQGAAHRFGGDLLKPELEADTTFNKSTNGIADLAVRLKYVLSRREPLSLAALADVRIPTGDEHDFLGTGATNIRFLWIMSSSFGNFNPHLNLGYDRRGGNDDSNEFEYVVGFDQKVSDKLTFAIDLLGTYDLEKKEAIRFFSKPEVSITEEFEGGSLTRTIDLGNIPDRWRDNTLDLAMGFRVAPLTNIVFFGNALVPINSGGLRSSIIPTFGLSISI